VLSDNLSNLKEEELVGIYVLAQSGQKQALHEFLAGLASKAFKLCA